ncbi:ABC transporter ATP-binding protein [Jidongwangia harbinensis]|uniref:ABC transporter ATP-binding protein n=1 Tax=Jidongwangia harbinensis TaxID=2878561 RepID=UPI001CDA0BBA|nr:ABC transporter ATP-binding protein [Jidongwangia harbinensis]MCA2212045.1 ABC transporter ATP-binding protein [Jidongwangia harbinensis]
MLTISHLQVRFGRHTAVDDVSLGVGPAEAVGLIGASGSGKTMTSLAVLGLLPSGARTGGTVTVDGRPVLGAAAPAPSRLWGRRLALVGQDALAALNPLVTVGRQVAIPLRRHLGLTRRPLAAAVTEILDRVGLPAETRRAYPAQLSGGQRQRVAIAMATAGRPALLIADEPTSALDPTTQAGILTLLGRLPEHGTSLLLISHDIAVVSQICHRLVVLHQGRTVEQGRTAEVLSAPAHPHTAELVAAARAMSLEAVA